MTEERKFTTGFGKEITTQDELVSEIPPAIRKFMRVEEGEFSHEIHRNGAVIISPKTPVQNTPQDSVESGPNPD